MMKMEIPGFEVVEDRNGKHIKEYTEIRDIPDDKVWEEDICTICGWPTYPECKKSCHNFRNESDYED